MNTQHSSPLRLLISCGEPSGDLYGAELVRHLRLDVPGLEVFGLGGDRLQGQGAQLIAHLRELAVVGLLEVLSRLSHIQGVFRRVLSEVDRARPDLAVLIDYADFNLRLAKEIHRRGIPVVYYVSPQVWAWRKGRIQTLRKTAARMIVIFPFEEEIYREAGIPVTFVGHPLVGALEPKERDMFLTGLQLDPRRPLVAVLPGSRVQEVAHNLPPLVGAVRRLQKARPELQFLLAVAPSLDPQALGKGLDPPLKLVTGETHSVLASATIALVASGTATIEAALLGTPMVVVYRLSPLTYILGRPFMRVPHFAMTNLIAGRKIVPEMIQGDFTAERVSEEALRLLADPEALRIMKGDLAKVRERLGDKGASARAAAAVLSVLGRSEP